MWSRIRVSISKQAQRRYTVDGDEPMDLSFFVFPELPILMPARMADHLTSHELVATIRNAWLFNALRHHHNQIHQMLWEELSDISHTGVVQSANGQPFQARLSLEERLCGHRSPNFLVAVQ